MAYCISDIPRTIKRVVVLTNHHADGLCPLYDNETRLNDPSAPGRNKNEWDKTKGRERWRGEKSIAHVFSLLREANKG